MPLFYVYIDDRLLKLLSIIASTDKHSYVMC